MQPGLLTAEAAPPRISHLPQAVEEGGGAGHAAQGGASLALVKRGDSGETGRAAGTSCQVERAGWPLLGEQLKSVANICSEGAAQL